MSKRSAPRGMQMPRMGSGGAQNALQALQQKMLETQEALGNELVEVTAGGGAIKVVISGRQELKSISISPDVMNAGDVEMLQDLILAAVNEALAKSQELASQKMSAVTGGLGLPGLM